MIERFLPAQISDAEAEAAIQAIIAETGASSMKDMGRVMALVKERLGGAIEPARASGLVKARCLTPSHSGRGYEKGSAAACGGAGMVERMTYLAAAARLPPAASAPPRPVTPSIASP